jgi:hypothetical protein
MEHRGALEPETPCFTIALTDYGQDAKLNDEPSGLILTAPQKISNNFPGGYPNR